MSNINGPAGPLMYPDQIFRDSTYYTLPIMLALCLMLLGTYYAQNYAGIIGRSLNRDTGAGDHVRSQQISQHWDHVHVFLSDFFGIWR